MTTIHVREYADIEMFTLTYWQINKLSTLCPAKDAKVCSSESLGQNLQPVPGLTCGGCADLTGFSRWTEYR